MTETVHGQVTDHAPEQQLVILIDRTEYKVASAAMTGSEIRDLPTPAIGPDRDLYLQGHGHEDDQLIADTQVVDLKNGMHFFSAPRTITPGWATYAPPQG